MSRKLGKTSDISKKNWLLTRFVETEDGIRDKIFVCTLKK